MLSISYCGAAPVIKTARVLGPTFHPHYYGMGRCMYTMLLDEVWQSRRLADSGLRSIPIRRESERECMDFLRNCYDSQLLDEVRQSTRLADLGLRSTPIRIERMCGFPEELL